MRSVTDAIARYAKTGASADFDTALAAVKRNAAKPERQQSLRSTWAGGYTEWLEGNTAYLSVVFSWKLAHAKKRAKYWKRRGYHVRAGGPAVIMQPAYLADVAEIGGEVDALVHHNSEATRTTVGCSRGCAFCIVGKVEGKFRELPEWEPRRVLVDNNILMSSRKHFERVIDSLRGIKRIDFNQGLDCRLLTKWHAEKFRELHMLCVRMAWDNMREETDFLRAHQVLRDAGFPKTSVRVYVLIGYEDTPADALYRCQTIRDLGGYPYVMRYQPLLSAKKNSYVAMGWTEAELVKMQQYWTNIQHTCKIPYGEFDMARHQWFGKKGEVRK